LYKTVCLLKRRPDLTMEQFIDHYENVHRKIGERLMGGLAVHYSRRFLRRVEFPMQTETQVAEQPFDVIMELWYESEESFRAALKAQTPENLAEIVADEENFIDRTNMHLFWVEEHESAMPPLPTE